MNLLPPDVISFDNFVLSLRERTLSENGQPVRIGSRALDILFALVEREGELVTRAELMAKVWPDTTVDENALRVHLSGLRKALGEKPDTNRFILNEAGRGYRFIGKIRQIASSEASASSDNPPQPEVHLPKNLGRVIGREEITSGLVKLLDERRFLTIVGPGGIGKTTVAIAVAQDYAARHRTSAYFIDLAPLSDPALVTTALATQLGLAASVTGVEQAILNCLRSERALLLFDNCEHLVEAVAALTETILQGAPDLVLLVTSREPLRAEAEWVFRLPSLEAPVEDVKTAQDAIRYSAVQLFCERAKASYHEFELLDADVSAVKRICRQLDGIPLAIEMAAARMDSLDASDIAARLDDRFSLLTKGRRTALPRQKTLRATLEWSHDFLSDRERSVFRSLSVFRTYFQLDAVIPVSGLPEAEAMETLTGLVSKSLVTMDRNGRSSLYRLLDTTRFYAEERLIESGEESRVRHAHAVHTLALFTADRVAWDGNDPRQSLAQHGWRVDDLRAALDWCFANGGDARLGVELASASAALWFHLSLPDEYLSLLRRAIRAVEGTDIAGTHAEAEVMAAYGHALWHIEGPGEEMKEAFLRAMEVARACEDEPGVLRAAWGLWAQAILTGDYARSLSLAENFKVPAYETGEVAHILTADHMLALSHHFMGHQAEALKMLHQVIAGDQTPDRTNHTNHAQVDGKTAVLSLLMRILWLQGAYDVAVQTALDCAAHVKDLCHDLTTCYGLAIGCIPVAIWAGKPDLAAEWNAMLAETTARKGMRHWEIWAVGFDAGLGKKQMLPIDATAMQMEVFATLGARVPNDWLHNRLTGEQESWCAPEMMRLLALSGRETSKALEAAQELAQTQGASFWGSRLDGKSEGRN